MRPRNQVEEFLVEKLGFYKHSHRGWLVRLAVSNVFAFIFLFMRCYWLAVPDRNRGEDSCPSVDSSVTVDEAGGDGIVTIGKKVLVEYGVAALNFGWWNP